MKNAMCIYSSTKSRNEDYRMRVAKAGRQITCAAKLGRDDGYSSQMCTGLATLTDNISYETGYRW